MKGRISRKLGGLASPVPARREPRLGSRPDCGPTSDGAHRNLFNWRGREAQKKSFSPALLRGIPRIELGTSRTRSEHYTTKPNPRLAKLLKFKYIYFRIHQIYHGVAGGGMNNAFVLGNMGLF